MEKYSSCTSLTFKKDISELCGKCPLVELITTGMQNQIVSEVLEQKSILTEDQFQNYINAEVENAKDAMQRTHLTEQQNKDYKKDPYRAKRIEHYIWNKERIKVLNSILSPQLESGRPKNLEVPAKYYALYHWILIELGKEMHFERNSNDQYDKKAIMNFAQERYPQTSPQGFYREFTGIDVTNKTAIARSFGKGYKERIILLSSNDSKIITHLKNYPN